MKYKKNSDGSISLSWADFGITDEDLEREMAIYCDCDEPDEHPEYADRKVIEGVGLVDHHGWICRKCGKYVQVG